VGKKLQPLQESVSVRVRVSGGQDIVENRKLKKCECECESEKTERTKVATIYMNFLCFIDLMNQLINRILFQ
jgi:hypothetical protein